MRISVFGLGYVGAVTAACFANDGHEVIGVDVSAEKVAAVARGESPIVEPRLPELLAAGAKAGLLRGTTDAYQAVLASDASLISVGTPPTDRGAPDLRFVYEVCRQIGEAARKKGQPHVVILRSTVPPGTYTRCREILDEASGGVPTPLAFNPEFLREGAAIADYYGAPFTVIGTRDAGAEAVVREIYQKVEAPVHVVEPEVAEMVKYVANAWHAAKIGFANEIGRLSQAFGVDGRDVMKLITLDSKLNVSPAYMRPGYAYGGSCLPKDLGAMLYHAQARGVDVPLLKAIPESNRLMISLAADEVVRLKARRVAVFGLAFKAGTDDLRESPAVPLVKRLLGEGCEVRLFDPFVSEAHLMGTNLAFIQTHIPHFERLLERDAARALEGAELVVVTYPTPAFVEALQGLSPNVKILDLGGQFTARPEGVEYHGLCW